MGRAYIRRGFMTSVMLTLLLALAGCGGAPAVTEGAQPARLLFATDTHFYAPEFIGDFERFSDALEYGDGKVVQYSSELAQTLVDTALHEKPDALLLGGDLSFNGEYDSHRELSDMLKPVRDAGIPVLVVPGNHDINQISAFRFADGESCASIDAEGFRELYGALGMNEAASSDKDSLSYMYALNNDTYLLMLDTCDYGGIGRSTGSISDKTMKWIERQLKSAKKAGATVISASHHNLLQHNPMWSEPFVMNDSETLVKLLERYGVKLNLTGHIHTQNIVRAENSAGLSEVANGALLVSPNYYGVIEIGADKSIHYKAESLDVSGLAEKTGSTDANLLDFPKYSQAFFNTTTRNKVSESLERYQLSDEEKAQMIDFAELANRNYFGGTVDVAYDEMLKHPGYALWQEKCQGEFFMVYIGSMMDNAVSHKTLVIN